MAPDSTVETVQTSTDGSETVETKRTRYTGPVVLEDMGERETDVTTSGLGRGRPSVDLTPYKQILTENYAKNQKRKETEKIEKTFRVNVEALSTVKSRFNTAAAELNVGVRYTWVEDDNGEMGTFGLVAGKRLENRGRKPGTRNQPKAPNGSKK